MITRKSWDDQNQDKESLFSNCELNSNTLANQLFSEESYERKKAIGGLVHQFILKTEVKRSSMSSATTALIKWNAYMDDNHRALLDHIFDLVKTKVIKTPNVQQLEFKGQKLVIELFDALSSDPERLLPSSTRKRYVSGESAGQKNRVICDYISGMTDEYATRLYEKIYYPHKGSIFDRL